MLALSYFASTIGAIAAGVLALKVLDPDTKASSKAIAVFSLSTTSRALTRIVDWLDDSQPLAKSRRVVAEKEMLQVMTLLLERQEASESAICAEIRTINERFDTQKREADSCRAREFATSRAIRADVDEIRKGLKLQPVILSRHPPLRDVSYDTASTLVANGSKGSQSQHSSRETTTSSGSCPPLGEKRRIPTRQLQYRDVKSDEWLKL
jgi:hypothetical protein